METKAVRVFARGLAVLAALNRHGAASALDLARETGLPRASVYRLLQTLIEEGYVARSPSDERFVLRLKVRLLADGFEDEHWIGAIAAPALLGLTQRILWPCDVATQEGTRMIIRETTHRVAPLSVDHGMAGRAISLTGSSTGLAYLSALPRTQAQALARLALEADLPDPAAREAALARVMRQVAQARRQGYALRQAGPIWPHTGAIAMPIRHEGRAIGSINTVWMARVISAEEGLRRCLAPLRATAAQIEAGLAEEAGPGREKKPRCPAPA